MALLAESLVDEWPNRNGFFTIRGIKHGVGEIDLLGVRPTATGLEAWHVEVQASFRPIGYVAPLPGDALDGFAKAKTSMKSRPPELLERAVHAWVEKKFKSKSKHAARNMVWPSLDWSFVLVHAVVKSNAEVSAIAACNVRTIPLHTVLQALGKTVASQIRGGAGTDLSEVIEYFYKQANTASPVPSEA